MIEKWAQTLQDAMQKDKSLVDAYDAYQQLMTYWNDTLQDDCYMISRDGWKLTLLKGDKKNSTYEDMSCDLLPVNIVLQEFLVLRLTQFQLCWLLVKLMFRNCRSCWIKQKKK